MLSRHQTLAREFPFLCSSFRKGSTFRTTTRYPTGGGARRIRGANFHWTSKPLGYQKLPGNTISNFNPSSGSRSGDQCLLSGVTVSTLGFIERSDRRSFSISAPLLARARHKLSKGTDDTTPRDGGGGQGSEDTGGRVSRHNTEAADNNGRVLKVSARNDIFKFWEMIRAEISKLLWGRFGEEIREEKASPIPSEPVAENKLKDLPGIKEKVSPIPAEPIAEKKLKDSPKIKKRKVSTVPAQPVAEMKLKDPLEIRENVSLILAEPIAEEKLQDLPKTKQQKVSPITAVPVAGEKLKDPPREIPDKSPFVLQSSYADDVIGELKQSETPENNSHKQEQFVEQSSYSSLGLDLEEQESSPNTTSTLGIPDSSCRDEEASETTESEDSGSSSREIFRLGNSSSRGVSERKQAEIGTHSTTIQTPAPEKRADKVVAAKTKERKKVVGTKKAEAVAEIEATPKPKPTKSLVEFAEPLSWTEESYAPLTYHISDQTLLKKFSLKESSPLRYWCYDLYMGSAGEKINVHYCQTIEEFDRVAEIFLNDRILGFDLEWVPSNFSSLKSAKVNASLMQIANESNIALFHIARVAGRVPDFGLIPPNLRRVLESEDIMKTGVSVTGDAKRVSKFLGVHPAGIFELSDLWNLVNDVRTMAGSITRRLIALSRLTEECLYLPLDKSASRISNWAAELNNRQVQYAANDAYAAFRVFDALERKRHDLSPTPRFPGCRIIPPQEPPSDNDYPIIEEEVEEYDYKAKSINLDGPEVEKASSWATSFLGALAGSGIEAKAQHSQLKVYSLWHDGDHSVEKIAELCRNPPLKETTVVMHILEAIRLENLPYDDGRLAELRKRIPKPFMNGKYHWVFSAPNKGSENRDVYLS